jgi:hypothetical protein
MQDQPGKTLPSNLPFSSTKEISHRGPKAQLAAHANAPGSSPDSSQDQLAKLHEKLDKLQDQLRVQERLQVQVQERAQPTAFSSPPGSSKKGFSHRKSKAQPAPHAKALDSSPDSMQDQPSRVPDLESAVRVQERAQPTALSSPPGWSKKEISHREPKAQPAAHANAPVSSPDSMQDQLGKIPDLESAFQFPERAQPTALPELSPLPQPVPLAEPLPLPEPVPLQEPLPLPERLPLSDPPGWSEKEMSHKEPKLQQAAHANSPEQTRNRKVSLREQLKAAREKGAAEQATHWGNSFTPPELLRDQPTHRLWAQPATPERMRSQRASHSRAGSSVELKAAREQVAAEQATQQENSFTPPGLMRDQPTRWAQPATPERMRNQRASHSRGESSAELKAARKQVAAEQATRQENAFTPPGLMRDRPTHLLWAKPGHQTR